MAALNVDVGQVMSSVTLTVTFTRTYRLRMWLGAKIILLAALILGTSVSIEVEEAEPRRPI